MWPLSLQWECRVSLCAQLKLKSWRCIRGQGSLPVRAHNFAINECATVCSRSIDFGTPLESQRGVAPFRPIDLECNMHVLKCQCWNCPSFLLSGSDGTKVDQRIECQRHVNGDNMTEDFWLSLIERIYSTRLDIMSLEKCKQFWSVRTIRTHRLHLLLFLQESREIHSSRLLM